MEEIRLISAEELFLVREIVYQTWPHTYGQILSPAQIEYMLDTFHNISYLEQNMRDGHEFYVYFDNAKPLGFIGLHPNAEPNSVKLNKLYVLPESQGKSVGRKLFEKAEEVTLEHGMNRIFLNVNRFNKASEFYKNMGMSVFKEEDVDIGNGYLMEDFVMEKILI